jgi:UDPglucose--hexose-1-phosphate uridylyltransferase
VDLLRRTSVVARLVPPGPEADVRDVPVEIRWDPLTGQTARVLTERGLMRRHEREDLSELARSTRATCPFCSERIDEATPRFPPDVVPAGRLRRGQAVLVPNLFPYGRHSVVSVYSPRRHDLPLDAMTDRLVADNLGVQVEFARIARRLDPEAFVSVNANHMLPSGSSLFHPHLQGIADPVPTTMQVRLAEVEAERVRAYVEAERDGARWITSTGAVDWMASFAPVGPYELTAVVRPSRSPDDLSDELVDEVGAGIARALRLYASLGFHSFNLAMYGTLPSRPGPPLVLRMMVRSNVVRPAYRSDASYLERLHWEAAVDVSPERVAEVARSGYEH